MAVGPDNRLVDSPMVPVTCHGCGASVLARKSSWNQTSVQWDGEATARCLQRREADKLRHGRGPFLGCSDLHRSIEAAARRGALPILDTLCDNAASC